MSGHWGSPSMMASLRLSDFALRRVPKNRAHLPRTSSGSRSILPSSPLMYCELTFRVSSMFQGLEALEEPPLIALAQILLHTLDVSSMELFLGIVADPVNARVFSPDSFHQLTFLGASPPPLPGCSSRGHRHTVMFLFYVFLVVSYWFCRRPGSSEVPRNPLARWDVSSIPANGIFLTEKT